jgi:hypothetical protein
VLVIAPTRRHSLVGQRWRSVTERCKGKHRHPTVPALSCWHRRCCFVRFHATGPGTRVTRSALRSSRTVHVALGVFPRPARKPSRIGSPSPEGILEGRTEAVSQGVLIPNPAVQRKLRGATGHHAKNLSAQGCLRPTLLCCKFFGKLAPARRRSRKESRSDSTRRTRRAAGRTRQVARGRSEKA